jgi:hypothetical protein
MIGHLIESYVLGRDDALHGRPRRDRWSLPYNRRILYCLGYRDTLRRMKEERRLAQLAMDI